MSERPTPETDAEHAQFRMGGFTLDFCRKLERERDEAREALMSVAELYDGAGHSRYEDWLKMGNIAKEALQKEVAK